MKTSDIVKTKQQEFIEILAMYRVRYGLFFSDDNDRLLTESGFSYTYDDNGNMLMKTGNGVETHGHASLQYNALLSAATEGSTHYYHTDGLGSVRNLSDASGALTDRYTSDAYGLLTSSSGATVNPYLYRGEQYDADLNAYYLRARYYQPGIGRFLTTDPVEGFPTTPMSLHRYLYGNANPVSMLDPSGKMSVNEMIVTGGIVGNLAAIGIGTTTKTGRDVYAYLAKNIFPGAYIVGVTGTVSLKLDPLIRGLKQLLSQYLGVSLPPVTDVNGFYTEGFEVLLSVSSAQLAVFNVYGGGLQAQSVPAWPANFGGMYYKGFV